MHYRLYVRLPSQKRYKPMDWSTGQQVVNLIHATLFTESERVHVAEALDKNNPGLAYELRPVRL